MSDTKIDLRSNGYIREYIRVTGDNANFAPRITYISPANKLERELEEVVSSLKLIREAEDYEAYIRKLHIVKQLTDILKSIKN